MLSPLNGALVRRAAPLAVLTLALLASGCGGGGEKPLSQRTATALATDLDQASQRVGADECEAARRGTLVRLKRKVENLPAETDDAIRTTLEDGVDHLETLLEAECERQAREREKQREEEQQQQQQQQTVPTTPTETVPPPPTETQPPPTETTPPPETPAPKEEGGGGGLPAPEAGPGAKKKGKDK